MMSSQSKALCKWKPTRYAKDIAKLKVIVANPTHVCKSCGRAAGEKKYLCKPVKISD